jgi:hypothetical protein
VLQEDDSPVAARQVFNMLEQNQSPQELQRQRGRIEHCAGACSKQGLQLKPGSSSMRYVELGCTKM